MASSYDFFLTDTVDGAKSKVHRVFEEQGYKVTSTPQGNLAGEKGSMGLTVAFGALAGKSMHMKFEAQFFTDDQQRIVVRLSRNLGGGALKGGAIGASRTANAFQNLANVMGTTLNGAGVLAETKEN